MKKLFCLLLSILIMLSLFAGCSSDKGDTQEKTSSKSETTISEKETTVNNVELSFLTYETPTWTTEFYEKIINDFQTEYPNIKLKKEVYPTNERDKYIKTLIATNQMQDVIFTGLEEARMMDGVLKELSEDVYSLLEDSAIEKFNGKIVTMPLNKIILINTYYNKDMFSKYNLSEPQTWDEFVNICKTLKENGENPIVAGGPSGQAWNSGGLWHNALLTAHLFEADPEWPGKLISGEYKLNGPLITEATKRWTSLIDAGYYHEGSLSYDYSQMMDQFLKGNAGIICNGLWGAAEMDKANPSFEVGYFILPGIESQKYYPVMYGDEIGISANTKHPEEAEKLVKFIFSADTYKYIVNKMGGQSTVKEPIEVEMSKTSKEVINAVKGKVGAYQFMKIPNLPIGYNNIITRAGQDLLAGADVDKVLENCEKEFRALQSEQIKK